MDVVKRYRYRIYPNLAQRQFLQASFGCNRFVYNELLSRTIRAYQEHLEDVSRSKPKVSEFDMINMIPALRREYPWLKNVSSASLGIKVGYLGRAFTRFFNKQSDFPQFKKKTDIQTFHAKLGGFDVRADKLWLQKCPGLIRVKWSRDLGSCTKQVTIIQDADGRYYASFLCKVAPKITAGENNIGLDLGLKDLAVGSNGERISNPRFTNKHSRALRKAQRNLAKKQKGSNNRKKARLKVARIHAKVKACRLDHLHKLSRRLVNENQVIVFETLNVRGMVRNHSLAKSISDVAWGKLTRLTQEKAEESNHSKVVYVHPFFPSTHICSVCGNRHPEKLKLSIRNWICLVCGAEHDRDENAAKVLLSVYTQYGAGAENGALIVHKLP